jgi:hypothetical protein
VLPTFAFRSHRRRNQARQLNTKSLVSTANLCLPVFRVKTWRMLVGERHKTTFSTPLKFLISLRYRIQMDIKRFGAHQGLIVFESGCVMRWLLVTFFRPEIFA